MQRSPGVISAYFMSKHKKTLIESARFIIKQRPISFDHGININFLQSLAKYYDDFKKSSTNYNSYNESEILKKINEKEDVDVYDDIPF